jgi:xanthine dehydrogenase accessory factor
VNIESIVLIRGAGERATGCAYQLHTAGFRVVMTELAMPRHMRTTVSYASAMLYDTVIVAGVIARQVPLHTAAIAAAWADRVIPIVADPDKATIALLSPTVIIDARNTTVGASLLDAPLVIGLGEAFLGGKNCHVVLGTEAPQPEIELLTAPAPGICLPICNIGERVMQGAILGTVAELPILAPCAGVLYSMIDYAGEISAGMVIGAVAHHHDRIRCFTLSETSLDIGRAVLNAIQGFPPKLQ